MTAILQARRTAFRYPQDGRGLGPTTLTVRPGELVLVTGASGCGKSTLARCLTGLIPHLYRGTLSGEVRLDGVTTTAAPLWWLAERAGLVFQNPGAQMLAHSVEEEIIFGLENLGLPRLTVRRRLEAALDHFGLRALRHRSPLTLSGGEQQKLALAAISARQPPVLVLDEPLSMLDGTAAAQLTEHLQDSVLSGTAVVINEHRAGPLDHLPNLRRVHLDGRDPGSAALPDLCPARGPQFHLEVADLSVSMGGRPVLHGLSFSATGGQFIAIVGRNGVGKTTLLRALAGLQPHGGGATVNDCRPDVALVFQNPDLQLFNPTVRDEVLYRLPNPDMTLYVQLLDALGLSQYEETPPLLLSEGEKKRLALAVALMRRPRHGVLLDEPALGQDAAHKATLVKVARALAAAGQLVIMATHDLSLASQADRLLLLGPQGFEADGPPAAVMHDVGAWDRLGLPAPSWAFPPRGSEEAAHA